MRKIKVYHSGAFALTQHVHFFCDWFEFADWVKQECLQGRAVVITYWEYVDA